MGSKMEVMMVMKCLVFITSVHNDNNSVVAEESFLASRGCLDRFYENQGKYNRY